jgi:hypothetical protein
VAADQRVATVPPQISASQSSLLLVLLHASLISVSISLSTRSHLLAAVTTKEPELVCPFEQRISASHHQYIVTYDVTSIVSSFEKKHVYGVKQKQQIFMLAD